MLSTLRSMLPEEWGPDDEEAWNWLWAMIERLLRREHKKHRPRERLLGRALGSLEEDLLQSIREQAPHLCPSHTHTYDIYMFTHLYIYMHCC